MTTTEELHALDQLAERLHGRFPEAAPERIRTVVEQVHHQYDSSPIRDFIPVLVEREAVDKLRTTEILRQRVRA